MEYRGDNAFGELLTYLILWRSLLRCVLTSLSFGFFAHYTSVNRE